MIWHKQSAPAYDNISAFASVCLVARVLGVKVDSEDLSRRFGCGNECKLTLFDLLMSARTAGLKAHHKIVNAVALQSLPLPVLALVAQGRWVVLAQLDGERVLSQDPANEKNSQPTIESVESFLARFQGEVLLLKAHVDQARIVRFGLSWFLPYIGKYRRILTEVLIASIFLQILSLASPLFFQVVTDKVLAHRSVSTLDVIGFGLLAVTLFESVMTIARTYIFSHTTSKIDVELGSALFKHLLALPMAYFESRKVGDSVARVKELESLREFLTGHALTLVLDVLFSTVFIGVMLYYSVQLTVVTLLSVPLYAIITFTVVPILRGKLELKFERNAANQSMLVEAINGIQTIKGNALEEQFSRTWDSGIARYVSSAFSTGVIASCAQEAISITSKLTAVGILWFGAHQVMEGQLTIGMFIAFTMLSQRLTQPVMRIAQLWNDFQQVGISVRRLAEILDIPTENPEVGKSSVQPFEGNIIFSGVSFKYSPNGATILNELNLEINSGETVAFVGRSGSGKSTLTKLVQRLYSIDRGSITIDGVNLNTVNVAQLRRQIGVVLQENFLFARSIRDNISVGEPGAELKSIIEVAKLAGAHQFICALPNGYDTLLGEHGVGLSGGQRQRIAIARALLSNPRILILDEATSALDYESEAAIQENMKEICDGRTVIIIAHRLSAIRSAQRIFVMEAGQIAEQGNHAQLLADNGLYARLWAIQHETSQGAFVDPKITGPSLTLADGVQK